MFSVMPTYLLTGESVQTELVVSLAWMGISDPRLFDVIERRVRDEAEQSRNDRNKDAVLPDTLANEIRASYTRDDADS